MSVTESPVTPQEAAVIKASLAMSDKDLADMTGYSRQSLKNIRCAVYLKLRLDGPHKLFAAAVALGIIRFTEDS